MNCLIETLTVRLCCSILAKLFYRLLALTHAHAVHYLFINYSLF